MDGQRDKFTIKKIIVAPAAEVAIKKRLKMVMEN